MAKTIEQLLTEANAIKNETVAGQNTADRVGSMFIDIIEYVQTIQPSPGPDPGPTPSEDTLPFTGIDTTTPNVTVNQNMVSDPSEIKTEKELVSIYNKLHNPFMLRGKDANGDVKFCYTFTWSTYSDSDYQYYDSGSNQHIPNSGVIFEDSNGDKWVYSASVVGGGLVPYVEDNDS